MTSKMNHNDGRNPDAYEGVADDFEASTGQRVLEIARLIGFHLKRGVVFIPLFGVVFLIMGFLWLRGVQEERSLESKSESLLTRLSQPAPRPEMLSKQAVGWDTAYQVTLDARTARSTDSDLVGRVLDAATEAGLVILQTGTTDDDIVKLEDDKYTITPLILRANGQLDAIGKFLETLETDEFAAFEIQGSNMTAGQVGYLLTLQGVFYSLPENYGDQLAGDDEKVEVISLDAAGKGGVHP